MDPQQQQQQQHGDKNVIKGDALMHNMKQFELFHIVVYMAGGSVAGILGLTGFQGLFLLILVALLSSGGLLIRMKFDQSTFTVISPLSLLFNGLTGQAMTYILFWTLAFALVHLY